MVWLGSQQNWGQRVKAYSLLFRAAKGGKAFPSSSQFSVVPVSKTTEDDGPLGPGGKGYTPILDKAYTLTDVLLCDPHTTDVLDVLYHVV